jgi:hypothetical protein
MCSESAQDEGLLLKRRIATGNVAIQGPKFRTLAMLECERMGARYVPGTKSYGLMFKPES